MFDEPKKLRERMSWLCNTQVYHKQNRGCLERSEEEVKTVEGSGLKWKEDVVVKISEYCREMQQEWLK